LEVPLFLHLHPFAARVLCRSNTEPRMRPGRVSVNRPVAFGELPAEGGSVRRRPLPGERSSLERTPPAAPNGTFRRPAPSGSAPKKNRHGEQKVCARAIAAAESGVDLPLPVLTRTAGAMNLQVPLKLSSKGESCVSLPLFRLLQRLLRLRTPKPPRKCERKAKRPAQNLAQLREIRNRIAETSMDRGRARVDQRVHRARKRRRADRRCSKDGAVKCTNVMGVPPFGKSAWAVRVCHWIGSSKTSTSR
jgi:hypothetical protein